MNKKPISHAQLMANAWSQAAAWNLMYPSDVNVRVAGSTKKELAHGGSAFVIGNGVAVCTIVGRDGPVDLDSLEVLPESGEYPVACQACEPMVLREPVPSRMEIPKSGTILPPGWQVAQLEKPVVNATIAIELGSFVRSRFSGFRGLVTGIARYLHSEDSYLVRARTDDPLKLGESSWFTSGELELLEEPLEYFTKPGPTRAADVPFDRIPMGEPTAPR